MPQLVAVATIVGTLASVASTIATSVISAQEREKAEDAARRAARAQEELIRLEESAATQDEIRRGRKLAGAQRAAFGRSGVELTGSPIDVLLQTEVEVARNVGRLQLNFDAQRESVMAGLGITLGNIQAEQNLAIASSVNALGGTLLSGASALGKNLNLTPKSTGPTGVGPGGPKPVRGV